MALIPPQFLDCVTAIGVIDPKDDSKRWIGTGFFVGRFIKKIDKDKNQYNVYLVTNKHVLQDKKSIVLRFNPIPSASGAAEDFRLDLIDKDNNITWEGHPNPNVDISVKQINPVVLRQHSRQFNYFKMDSDFLYINDMVEIGTSEGDFIYALGFPLGLVHNDAQYVVSRSGSIARIRDLLVGKSDHFIADIQIFPGSSGSPIISKPEIVTIDGTKSNESACLMGIVNSYIPYNDIAISPQTKTVRVVFQENSGLANVFPVDYIKEVIEICYDKLAKKENSESTPTSQTFAP